MRVFRCSTKHSASYDPTFAEAQDITDTFNAKGYGGKRDWRPRSV